jgi:DNA-binding transcriptional LysR family regulator
MSIQLEELPSMVLFARVVQLRSFTAAANQAGIAKSAVSKRISLLEERLGVRLLMRTTRKLSVTEEGLRFYEHCASMLTAVNAAQDSVSASSQSARGPLRVNAPVTFSQMYLARAVAKFLAQHPEVELQLSTDDRIVDVVEGGFDVVLRITRLKDSSLVARRLASDRLVVCGSPDYLKRAGVPQSPDELVGHNCLHYGLVPLAHEWRFRGPGGGYSVPVRGNLVSWDGTVLRQAVVAGLGLAVLPHFMVAADVKSGRVQTVLDPFRSAPIGIYAVFANRKQIPLRTKLFLDAMSRYFLNPDWIALSGG